MNPFNSLPAEIIQEIIQRADFIGTESLLLVSPQVKAVFQAQPRFLTTKLFKSDSITQIPTIHSLCRNIALINHRGSHFSSLGKYLEACEAVPNFYGEMDTVELSQIISIAAQIQRLTSICLSIMHRNFISAIQKRPTGSLTGTALAQKASEPFSWMEYYRVS
ncbi:hypothetical protein BJY04DRAFT_213514 [Aspergillus karnatakaensis]|uniref:uncharacterized protein n=1 Tax=Aspergillus karnatakaensis TaxID=1810916 RepID=UPI003CCD418D